MRTKNWTTDDIPSQQGKTILITGANSGIGLQASTVLSGKGAYIIMAVRNIEKGREAVRKIQEKYSGARLDLMQLDLSDFNSIRKFSAEFHARYSQLHILMNNAGVMNPPIRQVTKQNFEIQFGTNHLGHFLLTGLLLDILKKTNDSRIVVQTSLAHKDKWSKPGIHFDDLNWEKSYNRLQAYAQSKLANMLFAYELDRKLKAHNLSTIVTASHPGVTKTNLQKTSGFFMSAILTNLMGQNIEKGTLPILRAATEPNLVGSEFFGPAKMNELRGYPEKVRSSEKACNKELAKKLWEVSENLTGITYNFS